MTWRRVPPVFSPIAPASLLRASGAALGLVSERRDALKLALTETFRARHAVLTDSGTSALVLALRAVVPKDAPVALPAYGCIDLIAAAVGANVRVALYDLDPETLSPDLRSVRATLDRGARALVVAPLYGYPPDMPGIVDAAREFGVPLIEDAAQAAGGTLNDRRVGSFGDFTILSFGRGKGTTAGSGGALLIRSESRLRVMGDAERSLKEPARGFWEIVALAAQWLLARPALYAIPSTIPGLKLGEMVYRSPRKPRTLSKSAAAALPFALQLDSDEVGERRRRAATLTAVSAASRRFTPTRPVAGANPGYLRFALLDTAGTGTPVPRFGVMRGYPVVLDEHSATQPVLIRQHEKLAGARTLRDKLFTLPTHSRMSARDMAGLAAWLRGPVDEKALDLRTNEAV